MRADLSGREKSHKSFIYLALWLSLDFIGLEGGADDRNRTGDLRVTSALLYQLSYIGVPARIISGEPSSRQRLMPKIRCNIEWLRRSVDHIQQYLDTRR